MHDPTGASPFAEAPLRRSRGSRGTVSFDLDETLIASPFPAVLREAAAVIAPDRADAVRADVVARHRALLADGDVTAYDWAAILHRVAADRGGRMVADLDALVAARSRDAARLLDPELPGLLADLRDDGWRVVVVTNGYRRFQVPPVEALGLAAMLDAMVTADDVGAAKPDPRIFAAAYGRRPGPRVHIGDSRDQDVVGAHRAGALSILVGAATAGSATGSTSGSTTAGDVVRPTATAPDVRAAIGLIDDVVTRSSAAPPA